jgi:hypothetical protein
VGMHRRCDMHRGSEDASHPPWSALPADDPLPARVHARAPPPPPRVHPCCSPCRASHLQRHPHQLREVVLHGLGDVGPEVEAATDCCCLGGGGI